MSSRIRSADELLSTLDRLLLETSSTSGWWNRFFTDRTRAVPFFVEWPDETLAGDFERDVLRAGHVLELGCGNGRNATYLAARGCTVDAIDFSEAAIAWAKGRAQNVGGPPVRYVCASLFDLEIEPASYDIVYDSGCFHHVAPHRREAYLTFVCNALKPGGVLSMICLTPDAGCRLTDLQVYEQRTLGGGFGYSEAELQQMFEPSFEIVESRRMNEMNSDAELYGKNILHAVRMRKRDTGAAVRLH